MSENSIPSFPAKTGNSLRLVMQSSAFVVLWLSEALSLVGDRLVMVALITLVYDRTGSSGAVGTLMVFKAIPALLLGSVAGVFVDHWNRKWIMVAANLFQGMLVFWLPVAPGLAGVFVIYLVMSTINQFFVPARAAAIPDLVPPDALMTANSLFAMSIVFAMAIGPGIGTWITEQYGLNAAFYVDSATFLIPAVAVMFLSIPFHSRTKIRFDLLKNLKEGLAFSLTQPVVLLSLVTITVGFYIVGTISVAGVVITRDVLHVATSKFGLIVSGLGGGMLLGALLSNFSKRWFTSMQCSLTGAILMGLAVMFLPFSSNLVMACTITALIGMGMMIVQINGQVLLQTIAPAMRGRLMGISQTLTGTASFLASALTGFLLEKISIPFVLGMVGVAALIVLSITAFRFGYLSSNRETSK